MPLTTIEEFSVSHLQVLDAEAHVDAELDPQLDADTLLAMYRAMLLNREIDERMLKLQRQGRLGTFPPTTGQEAAAVGPAFAMGDRDWLVSSFRELGARLVRGEPAVNTFLYYGGFEEGNLLPRGADQRMLPVAVPVSSQLLHAAGIAYAMKYRGEDAAVVTWVGDGGTSEGDFHEALNLAAVWALPVVFICQNNQWAISLPRARQSRSRTLAQKAIAYGMPGLQVDGNDVLGTYKATADALARARAGGGPTFIEAVTYRLMMHTTADDPRKYRKDEDVEPWRAKEPLVRFRRYLEGRDVLDDGVHERLMEEVKAEVAEAVRTYEALSQDVRIDVGFEHVFGTSHDVIDEQRQEFLAGLNEERARG